MPYGKKTVAVQKSTLVRLWTCFVRFSRENEIKTYDETFFSKRRLRLHGTIMICVLKRKW